MENSWHAGPVAGFDEDWDVGLPQGGAEVVQCVGWDRREVGRAQGQVEVAGVVRPAIDPRAVGPGGDGRQMPGEEAPQGVPVFIADQQESGHGASWFLGGFARRR